MQYESLRLFITKLGIIHWTTNASVSSTKWRARLATAAVLFCTDLGLSACIFIETILVIFIHQQNGSNNIREKSKY